MTDSSAPIGTFLQFLVIWNRMMNLSTPSVQRRMAEWLEARWNARHSRLLLMAFRGCGKSTISAVFSAWILYRDPDLRILVLAADSALAKKMVRQVKKIIELHPLTRHLKPKERDQWAGGRFTVNRASQLRDPSMLARGITSNITGSRADVIICDDVEVPNTSDTAEKRGDLRERLMEIEYVLTPGGTQLYIGTPHTYYSIYADEPRREIGEEMEFLRGFDRLAVPLLDETGASAWPEKFTGHDIERMKTRTGPNKFASQMMLRPVNISEGRLDPSLLNVYAGELGYSKELKGLYLDGKKLVGASAWWDPAFGAGRGDNSVVAVVFTDGEGKLYLHRVVYLSSSHLSSRALGLPPPTCGGRIEEGGNDEASHQCRQVARMAKDNMLPSLTVETNGIGKFLPGLLRNKMAEEKSLCRVQEAVSTRPKDIRILEAFDAILAARLLHVHESVLQTPFMMEMQEWRPGTFRGHDDGLDAVAGALGQQPVRLKRLYGQGRGHDWMRGPGAHKAGTEFEV